MASFEELPIEQRKRSIKAQQQPVISVDTKKKELVGNFKNGGTDYRPKGNPCSA
jgi:Rhodopirellula transposase DDE domain